MRVLRVIARLNVGGPAHHVTLLSERLDPTRYESRLVAGRVGPGEASLDHLAEAGGYAFRQLDQLGPELRPLADLRALVALVGEMRRFRPDIVHTHTAKAGLLGRIAARLVLGRRTVVVHTYHGHVLRGYFSPRTSALYRLLERGLARLSMVLVGVSEATVSELVELGVARRERFVAIPLGLDLEPFAAAPVAGVGAGLRDALGTTRDSLVLTFVGRLVPVKRVDLLLEAVAGARARGVDARLAIAGDGELRPELERLAEPLGDAVCFLGFRSDLPAIASETDVAVLASDHEGTPVALIEAGAAGVPAIATAAGGVADIVRHGQTGWTVPCGDAAALADAIVAAARHREELPRLGAAAKRHVLDRYGVDRLVGDVDRLYVDLLARRARTLGDPSRPGVTPWPSDMVRRLASRKRGS